MYACVMSRCIVGDFVSSDPAISFCLDAVYWGGWSSVSLFVHSSIRKQVSDGDAMWTCSRCFPGCPRPGSFAAEGADVESACTGGVCAGSTCAGGVDAVKH